MKRTRTIAAAAATLLVLTCAVFLFNKEPPRKFNSLTITERSGSTSSSPPSWPPTMGGDDVVYPRPVLPNDVRRRLLGERDLYAAIEHIGANGDAAEKLTVAEILAACIAVQRIRPTEEARSIAVKGLASRCERINGAISPSVALKRASQMYQGAADSSLLGQMTALSRQSFVQPMRLGLDETSIVNESLRSNDTMLMKAAAQILSPLIEDGSPDSKLRADAFRHAAELIRVEQGSDFDHLVACANQGHCSGTPEPKSAMRATDRRESAEITRLAVAYRLALLRGAPTSELLAIR